MHLRMDAVNARNDRRLEGLMGRPGGSDAPLTEEEHVVGVAQGEVEIMEDGDHGGPAGKGQTTGVGKDGVLVM